jgi:cell division protease FtsH
LHQNSSILWTNIWFDHCRPDDTDVDRWSLRQAVILICATNRPDELDESFVRPGRIDREIHIGLPGEEERISIFGVHSSGRPLAKDLDFRKVGSYF